LKTNSGRRKDRKRYRNKLPEIKDNSILLKERVSLKGKEQCLKGNKF
jgi:hypothetical protein